MYFFFKTFITFSYSFQALNIHKCLSKRSARLKLQNIIYFTSKMFTYHTFHIDIYDSIRATFKHFQV